MKTANKALVVLIAFGLGFGSGLRCKGRTTQTLPLDASEEISCPAGSQELLWADTPWFMPEMRAIAMMESSGGANQKPNVDGIVGIGQVEKCFYQDAKEYAKAADFPTYESLQGYDEEAFRNTCVVAWYWFKRYKANTPYLMFARYRKGPKGEKTSTGQAYATKALRIMNEKYSG